MSDDFVQLLTEDNQKKMFHKAFHYVKRTHKIVNLKSCLQSLFSEDTETEFIIPVGIASLSLVEQHKEEFDSIAKDLSKKIKFSIMTVIANKS